MYCNPTLSAEEFKTIHNALWELDCVTRQLESVLKPELYVKLAAAGSQIRQGLAGAYEQDNKSFDQRHDHYKKVGDELGIHRSVWSMYEVNDLNAAHPFEGAVKVVYKDHWGKKPAECQITGLTWAALWLAANACIRDSGDEHHVFIEHFEQDRADPTVLMLITGS